MFVRRMNQVWGDELRVRINQVCAGASGVSLWVGREIKCVRVNQERG